MSSGSHHVIEYRVAVLGSVGVGKSAIASGFCGVFTQGLVSTIDEIQKPALTVDDVVCFIDVLDSSRQIAASLDHIIQASHGVLLVFSVTDRHSFELISKLYDKVLRIKQVVSVPVVILGNKTDLPDDERVVSENEAKNLARDLKIPYFEVSAKAGQNVEESFTQVVQQIGPKKKMRSSRNDCLIA